jgi:hypothetical protein
MFDDACNANPKLVLSAGRCVPIFQILLASKATLKITIFSVGGRCGILCGFVIRCGGTLFLLLAESSELGLLL